ncbi:MULTISPECIES: response regulator transcription factor [Streptomycetaceae]|uniref:response regulator transcription factor n=1 Tax=Streptomycetaceae TaxID=2062 RepID=UPI00039B054E|nr:MULTISPECIES: response regulator transcription factor [Streptomycetaceae]MDX2851368.1 response regulator transcription factor [Streptomyces sp. PA03-3a]MYX38547.1 response regulator [Streptomyces sp. SID8377]
MRVLVVEDEEMLAGAIAEGLRQEAFAVDVVHDGEAALERLAVNEYDVMVLDRDLPKLHGDEVCRRTASEGAETKILMLTVSTTVAERVAGLSLGADDYLVKPFAFAELVARIRTLGRRVRPPAPPVLERAGIRLDPHLRETYRDGRFVQLSRKEFAVLEELLRGQGGPVSAEQLLERVWDENIDPFTTIVRVTIRSLRRKLGEPAVVETVTGVGYRIR